MINDECLLTNSKLLRFLQYGEHGVQVIYRNLLREVELFLRVRVVAPLLLPELVGVPMIAKFSRAWEDTKLMTKVNSASKKGRERVTQ